MSNQEKIDRFNRLFKIGDKINVELDDKEIVTYTVMWPATIIGGHTAVIWVEERAGCYDIDRVILSK